MRRLEKSSTRATVVLRITRGPEVKDWVSFWDSDHTIYVNARHLAAHYRQIAEDIIARLPSNNARVLDHGCGEALYANKIAEKCGGLFLCEAAPTVRLRVADRFKSERKIRVISPAEIERMPKDCLDLVVANSLLQYLKRDGLDTLLANWRRILKSGGSLIVADIIGPQQSALTDAWAILHFAARNRFLIAACIGLIRTAFSHYGKLRSKLGITQYSEEEMLSVLREAGFVAKRLSKNFGHNQQRMAFEALKPS